MIPLQSRRVSGPFPGCRGDAALGEAVQQGSPEAAQPSEGQAPRSSVPGGTVRPAPWSPAPVCSAVRTWLCKGCGPLYGRKACSLERQPSYFFISRTFKARSLGNIVLRLSNSYTNHGKGKSFTRNVSVLEGVSIPFNVESLTLKIQSQKDPQRNLCSHFINEAPQTRRSHETW